MAVRGEDVDLTAGVIRVERAYDDKGLIEPKESRRAPNAAGGVAKLTCSTLLVVR